MDRIEEIVAAHYGSVRVMRGITDALGRVGVDASGVKAGDLKPVDEFHTGGVEATDALLEQLEIISGTRVLDMGCGIGGTARLIAERYGASVIGVDLTEEYVRTARELSAMVGLDRLASFRQGSVTALPLEDASMDLALLQHVGMNVADKRALFREAARVLRPGGTFALFEVMRGPSSDPLQFPVPWATSEETSFVAPPEEYLAAAEAAGLRLRSRRDRSEFATAFFTRQLARIAAEGPPAIGLHLLMGESGREKIQNLVANLQAGRVAPTEMIFDRP